MVLVWCVGICSVSVFSCCFCFCCCWFRCKVQSFTSCAIWFGNTTLYFFFAVVQFSSYAMSKLQKPIWNVCIFRNPKNDNKVSLSTRRIIVCNTCALVCMEFFCCFYLFIIFLSTFLLLFAAVVPPMLLCLWNSCALWCAHYINLCVDFRLLLLLLWFCVFNKNIIFSVIVVVALFVMLLSNATTADRAGKYVHSIIIVVQMDIECLSMCDACGCCCLFFSDKLVCCWVAEFNTFYKKGGNSKYKSRRHISHRSFFFSKLLLLLNIKNASNI